VIFNGMFPVLVMVSGRDGGVGVPTATLPKVRDEGRGPTTGPLPEPERGMYCGLGIFVALSAMGTVVPVPVPVPVTAAVVVGVKVTPMLQVPPPAATGTPTLQVVPVPKLNSLEFGPAGVKLLIINGELPVLVSVTICTALGVLRGWAPKLRLVGLN
jgi:hypothetical protein